MENIAKIFKDKITGKHVNDILLTNNDSEIIINYINTICENEKNKKQQDFYKFIFQKFKILITAETSINFMFTSVFCHITTSTNSKTVDIANNILLHILIKSHDSQILTNALQNFNNGNFDKNKNNNRKIIEKSASALDMIINYQNIFDFLLKYALKNKDGNLIKIVIYNKQITDIFTKKIVGKHANNIFLAYDDYDKIMDYINTICENEKNKQQQDLYKFIFNKFKILITPTTFINFEFASVFCHILESENSETVEIANKILLHILIKSRDSQILTNALQNYNNGDFNPNTDEHNKYLEKSATALHMIINLKFNLELVAINELIDWKIELQENINKTKKEDRQPYLKNIFNYLLEHCSKNNENANLIYTNNLLKIIIYNQKIKIKWICGSIQHSGSLYLITFCNLYNPNIFWDYYDYIIENNKEIITDPNNLIILIKIFNSILLDNIFNYASINIMMKLIELLNNNITNKKIELSDENSKIIVRLLFTLLEKYQDFQNFNIEKLYDMLLNPAFLILQNKKYLKKILLLKLSDDFIKKFVNLLTEDYINIDATDTKYLEKYYFKLLESKKFTDHQLLLKIKNIKFYKCVYELRDNVEHIIEHIDNKVMSNSYAFLLKKCSVKYLLEKKISKKKNKNLIKTMFTFMETEFKKNSVTIITSGTREISQDEILILTLDSYFSVLAKINSYNGESQDIIKKILFSLSNFISVSKFAQWNDRSKFIIDDNLELPSDDILLKLYESYKLYSSNKLEQINLLVHGSNELDEFDLNEIPAEYEDPPDLNFNNDYIYNSDDYPEPDDLRRSNSGGKWYNSQDLRQNMDGGMTVNLYETKTELDKTVENTDNICDNSYLTLYNIKTKKNNDNFPRELYFNKLNCNPSCNSIDHGGVLRQVTSSIIDDFYSKQIFKYFELDTKKKKSIKFTSINFNIKKIKYEPIKVKLQKENEENEKTLKNIIKFIDKIKQMQKTEQQKKINEEFDKIKKKINLNIFSSKKIYEIIKEIIKNVNLKKSLIEFKDNLSETDIGDINLFYNECDIFLERYDIIEAIELASTKFQENFNIYKNVYYDVGLLIMYLLNQKIVRGFDNKLSLNFGSIINYFLTTDPERLNSMKKIDIFYLLMIDEIEIKNIYDNFYQHCDKFGIIIISDYDEDTSYSNKMIWKYVLNQNLKNFINGFNSEKISSANYTKLIKNNLKIEEISYEKIMKKLNISEHSYTSLKDLFESILKDATMDELEIFLFNVSGNKFLPDKITLKFIPHFIAMAFHTCSSTIDIPLNLMKLYETVFDCLVKKNNELYKQSIESIYGNDSFKLIINDNNNEQIIDLVKNQKYEEAFIIIKNSTILYLKIMLLSNFSTNDGSMAGGYKKKYNKYLSKNLKFIL